MKKLLLVMSMAVAAGACGGKTAAPAEPVGNAGSTAAAAPTGADAECMQNCMGEGPMDEMGHFVYGAESEESWSSLPAAHQTSECENECAAAAEDLSGTTDEGEGDGSGTGMALDEANGTN